MRKAGNYSIARRPVRRDFTFAAVTILSCTAPSVSAQQPILSGYVTATSDYRQRGLSESRGLPSLVLGGDYQHRSGFFAGAWAARIEYEPDAAQEGSGRLKLGYYGGLTKSTAKWSWVASVARYAYPNIGFDYDYHELSGSAAFRDRWFFTVAYTDDWYSRGASAWYGEVSGSLPLPLGFELGATLGRLESSTLHYINRQLGLSKVIAGRLGLDLRYYDSSPYYTNSIVTTAGDAWVVSASFAFGGR